MHFHKQSFKGNFLTTCSCLLLDTYPEFWMRMSPPLTQAPWSLFLKEINLSIRAATRGLSGSASWWGRNLEQMNPNTQYNNAVCFTHVIYVGLKDPKDKHSCSSGQKLLRLTSGMTEAKTRCISSSFSIKVSSRYNEEGTQNFSFSVTLTGFCSISPRFFSCISSPFIPLLFLFALPKVLPPHLHCSINEKVRWRELNLLGRIHRADKHYTKTCCFKSFKLFCGWVLLLWAHQRYFPISTQTLCIDTKMVSHIKLWLESILDNRKKQPDQRLVKAFTWLSSRSLRIHNKF